MYRIQIITVLGTEKPDRILKLKGLLGKWEEIQRPDERLVQAPLETRKDVLGSCRPETGKAALRHGGMGATGHGR